ncbi:XRE family transcriptional regulator [Lacticaseibacillus suibinensis]|uniref:XRE family transcriptional regulator n=1 Tax=Lacticaseibacillus suibinensis TaxID=2486011 RepID=UPI000F78CEFB|nr:XRE family transcriptional regulator [Lacticaseibacillus suibinensis]
MHVNTLKLKGKIVERQMTQEGVAKEIGIDRSSFYRKMKKGGETFTVGDIHSMILTLNLGTAEIMDIFFDEKGAETHLMQEAV